MVNDILPQSGEDEDQNLPKPEPGGIVRPAEPTFQTPEQIAVHDDSPAENAGDSPKKKRWQWHWPPTKKEWVVIAVVIILIAGGLATFFLTRHPKPPAPIKHVAPKALPTKPVSTTVSSTLTGLPVDPSANKRPVTGVMIENSDFARPQSGLDQAGIVFEAVAEGGITRFLALYQDTQPGYLGPVRSARPYYLQWCLGFDCALAHVGGSPEAMNDIQSWHVKNLDEFYNAGAYERITSRFAPHNVYTSASQLNTLEAAKGYNSSQFTGFARKGDQPLKTPTATLIDVNPSSTDFSSHYNYDAAANDYQRSEGGVPHMEVDASGHQVQIAPKVVIVLVMPQGIEADDLHTSYNTIGSGQAFVFQDGGETTGTWQKSSSTSQFVFTDNSVKPIKLNAGQTWITVIGKASDVSYKT